MGHVDRLTRRAADCSYHTASWPLCASLGQTPYTTRAQGGVVNGVQHPPVEYLMLHLAAQYADLGEEIRLEAVMDLWTDLRAQTWRTHPRANSTRFATLRDSRANSLCQSKVMRQSC